MPTSPTQRHAASSTTSPDEVAALAAASVSYSGAWRRARERILITGIGGNLGRRLTQRLHRRASVIGIDRRPVPGLPKDVELHRVDIRRRQVEDIFRTSKASAVVHLNIMHDPRASQEELHSFNIVGTSKVIEYCQRFDIPKLVLLSSANVYGPSPDNNQFLDEQSPLMAATGFGDIRSLVELDMLGSTFFWRYPSIESVILRPVHILGAVTNAASNYLRLKRPISLMGFDPMVQVIHIEDVVSAIERALKPGIKGIFNVVGPGEAPLSALFKALGTRSLPLPGWVARKVAQLAWRARLSDFPPPELEHLRFICMADGRRARESLGFDPAYDLPATIQAIHEDPV
jgi:UDP-glucose 4-epimerase